MKPDNRFSSWDNTDEIEEKVAPEPEAASEQSLADKVFAEVLEADKNRPAIINCNKETWPEVKKLIKEAIIRSRYNHNRITLD